MLDGFRLVLTVVACAEDRAVDLNTLGPNDGLVRFKLQGRWLEDELDTAYAPKLRVLLRYFHASIKMSAVAVVLPVTKW